MSLVSVLSLVSILSLLTLLCFTGTTVQASAPGLEASREISTTATSPGETFTVNVHIRAGQYLEAPALEENLPEGWNITQINNDGAVFRKTVTIEATTLEWVWAESLSEGEEKTVAYEVTVPQDFELGIYSLAGHVSAYSLSAVPVAGDSQVFVTLPPPEARFSASPLSGTAPLIVTFTDLSTGSPDTLKWDFDGDGVFDSTEKNPSYTYDVPGSYTVTLLASNNSYGNGTYIMAGYITVTGKSASKSAPSGGGGGGGGGAGSPEPNSNIELKEISNTQVFKGAHTIYTFKAETNDIMALEFDPKRSFGKTTAIIEMLKDTSSMVGEPAPGKVYKNINIWVGNSGFSSPENLENAKINFRVNRTWALNNCIDQDTITLYRHSEDKWDRLPTSLTGEDENYLYFTAEAPCFSPFAITGRENGSQEIEILPLASETQVINGEKLTEEGLSREGLSGKGSGEEGDGEEAGNPASDQEKGSEPESAPGPGTAFTAAGLLVSYSALKRGKKE